MWEINNFDQTFTFIIFLICGIALKLFYDIMRAKRKVRKSGWIRVFIFDILFWSVNAAVTFLLLLARTNGQVRGYSLFAELSGFVICHFTFSKIWMKILVGIIKLFYKLTDKISYVLCFGASLLTCYTGNFFKFLLKCVKKGIKTVKKLLKNMKCMLYTEKNHNLNGEEVNA